MKSRIKKLDLSNVTAICIHGDELTEEMALRYRKIVSYMTDHIDFAAIRLLMSTNPNVKNAEFIQIPEIPSYESFQQFCLSEVSKHVQSDFCLIFQADGFIINPELWRPIFLEYDYIGAPWPPLHPWPEPDRPDRRVGNGGFSIRSKRLLEAVKDFEANQNEDIVIVCERRDELESKGLRFAPVHVAIDFSIETQFLQEQSMSRCFGFHGKYRVDESLRIISAKSDQD